MSFKNFSDFNQALPGLARNEKQVIAQRLLNASSDRFDSIKSLPQNWGDAYSGVQVMEYDQDGHASDQTASVVPNALSIVDNQITSAKTNFNTQQAMISTLSEQLGNAQQSVAIDNTESLSDIIEDSVLDPAIPGDVFEIGRTSVNILTSCKVDENGHIQLSIYYGSVADIFQVTRNIPIQFRVDTVTGTSSYYDMLIMLPLSRNGKLSILSIEIQYDQALERVIVYFRGENGTVKSSVLSAQGSAGLVTFDYDDPSIQPAQFRESGSVDVSTVPTLTGHIQWGSAILSILGIDDGSQMEQVLNQL